MDYELVAANVRASYREIGPKYRDDDEIEVTTENHRRLSNILGAATASFNRPISVLDAGCGTGRYFHCLRNVEELVGIDISPDMLEAAESPVLEEEVTAGEIQLICENIYTASFPAGSFDFIYSLGMFGHGCPVTLDLCGRFHEWLKPNGRLFFNVVDLATLSFRYRLRKRLRPIVYPLLPPALKRKLDERQSWLPLFGVTRRELRKLMAKSRFREYAVSSHVCQSSLWQGVLVECSATRQSDTT
jgi:SAM-dependent methyltransferase